MSRVIRAGFANRLGAQEHQSPPPYFAACVGDDRCARHGFPPRVEHTAVDGHSSRSRRVAIRFGDDLLPSLPNDKRALRGNGPRERAVQVDASADKSSGEQKRQCDKSHSAEHHGLSHVPGKRRGDSRNTLIPRRPATKFIAAAVVVSHRCDGTDADAQCWLDAQPGAATGEARPRRVSATRSFARALARRLRTVPTGQLSRPAISSMRLAFQVSQHHSNPKRLRQSVDFLVQTFRLLTCERCLLGGRYARVMFGTRISAGIGDMIFPSHTCGGAGVVPSRAVLSAAKRRRASLPACLDHGSSAPAGPGRGTRPGRHPRRDACRAKAGCKRSVPLARGGVPRP